MGKKVGGHTYAILGDISTQLRDRIAAIGAVQVLTHIDLAVASADALSHLHTLVIAGSVDTRTLTTWLPSLRTANPTMNVLGLRATGDMRLIENWVDELLSPDDIVARLEEMSRKGRLLERLSVTAEYGRKVLAQIAAITVLLLLWWVIVIAFDPAPYMVPSPARVLDAFIQQPDRFAVHLLTTAHEATLGFFVGNTLGIGLAVMLHRYTHLQKLSMPVLISFQAIPIVAFAPLLGVWLGTGLASKIAMAAIICFFPIVVNTLQAFAAVDREYLELFTLYRARYAVSLKRLLVPASSPAIIAALKISAGLSVVGAIVAEMTGADRGLGYLILNGAYRLETDIMFVAMLLSALLGVTFFHLPELSRTLLPRQWTRGLIQ